MPRAPSEWFRNKRWSTEIEQSFFTRLARSRTQRDQNLVIQAVELVDSRPDVALRLIEVYFESRTSRFTIRERGTPRQAPCKGWAKSKRQWRPIAQL
jgi:hypothetical protein